MEEVWNDINLSSLHDHRSASTPTTAQTFPFQDFFSKPSLSYNKDPPLRNDVSSAGDTISIGLGSLHKRPSSTTGSPSLGFRFLETSGPISQNPALENNYSTSRIKKRVQQKDNDFTSDLKHTRLMKNRESAARSRARKQAYTNELEHEVAHLRKENARLKKQLTQFSSATPTEVPKKRTLYRTLTSPF